MRRRLQLTLCAVVGLLVAVAGGGSSLGDPPHTPGRLFSFEAAGLVAPSPHLPVSSAAAQVYADHVDQPLAAREALAARLDAALVQHPRDAHLHAARALLSMLPSDDADADLLGAEEDCAAAAAAAGASDPALPFNLLRTRFLLGFDDEVGEALTAFLAALEQPRFTTTMPLHHPLHRFALPLRRALQMGVLAQLRLGQTDGAHGIFSLAVGRLRLPWRAMEQMPATFVPALPASPPWYPNPRAALPAVAGVESQLYPLALAELRTYLGADATRAPWQRLQASDRALIAGGADDWREIGLFDPVAGWSPLCATAFADTCAFLRRQLPEATGTIDGSPVPQGGVAFLALAPGGALHPHFGPTNERLTLHLGLHVPPNKAASITVAGETHHWQAGRAILFDDSFVHAVENNHADQPRIILYAAVWHPAILEAMPLQIAPPIPQPHDEL